MAGPGQAGGVPPDGTAHPIAVSCYRAHEFSTLRSCEMDALENLLTRRSPAKLAEPAPSPEALARAMAAAVRAPDHGRLQPWRFIVIDSPARTAFGEVMARCLKRQEPGASDEMLAREREKALRAPMIVVAVAKVQPQHPKIPEVEQLLAAAAATQNFWLALHAQGYGAMWKTGAPAYDAEVWMAE